MRPAVAQANTYVVCISSKSLLSLTKLRFAYGVRLITFGIRGSLLCQHPTQLYNEFGFHVIKAGVHMLACGYLWLDIAFDLCRMRCLLMCGQKLQTVAILK